MAMPPLLGCGAGSVISRRGTWVPSLSSVAATGSAVRSGKVTRSAGATSNAAAMRFSQSTETVRVPVSRRPIVWAVVGGTHRCATSSRVSPLALRT
ncbi:hypothetical protein WR25_19906 [Diploscapter pachys]|uniref:Uncharacterized protein n=1 Tax=Diploscapter pachys TaxID=2018661 RepID=A0A2A2JX48_9BILA|nr:hypothetical protein WR25_19906 [Diploscapter pachys]